MLDDNGAGSDRLPRSPGVKIVRAGEEGAWRDGFRYLDEAKRVHAAERARGYAEGRAAGVKDAGILIAETAAKVDGYMATMEPQIAALAFDIVRRVLNDFDDAELVERAARTALAEFRDAHAIVIKVHPAFETHMRNALADMLPVDGTLVPVTIESDPKLDRRSCILATDFAVVEASIDIQLAAIAEAMKHIQAKG
jgi:type III secretion protein L